MSNRPIRKLKADGINPLLDDLARRNYIRRDGNPGRYVSVLDLQAIKVRAAVRLAPPSVAANPASLANRLVQAAPTSHLATLATPTGRSPGPYALREPKQTPHMPNRGMTPPSADLWPAWPCFCGAG